MIRIQGLIQNTKGNRKDKNTNLSHNLWNPPWELTLAVIAIAKPKLRQNVQYVSNKNITQ
jgi:hypothetical protein